MIVQCPACRALVDVQRARVDQGGARAGLPCAECGAVAWLPAEGSDAGLAGEPPAASAEEPPEPASEAVAEPAPEEDAAPAPGQADDEALVDALAAMEIAEGGEGIRDDLIALLQKWSDEPGHKALVQRALLSEQLAVVGHGYRVVLEHRPDDEMATKGRDKVLAAAMTQLSELPSGGDDLATTKKIINVVGVAVAVLIAAVAAYYMLRMFGPAPPSPE